MQINIYTWIYSYTYIHTFVYTHIPHILQAPRETSLGIAHARLSIVHRIRFIAYRFDTHMQTCTAIYVYMYRYMCVYVIVTHKHVSCMQTSHMSVSIAHVRLSVGVSKSCVPPPSLLSVFGCISGIPAPFTAILVSRCMQVRTMHAYIYITWLYK